MPPPTDAGPTATDPTSVTLGFHGPDVPLGFQDKPEDREHRRKCLEVVDRLMQAAKSTCNPGCGDVMIVAAGLLLTGVHRDLMRLAENLPAVKSDLAGTGDRHAEKEIKALILTMVGYDAGDVAKMRTVTVRKAILAEADTFELTTVANAGNLKYRLQRKPLNWDG